MHGRDFEGGKEESFRERQQSRSNSEQHKLRRYSSRVASKRARANVEGDWISSSFITSTSIHNTDEKISAADAYNVALACLGANNDLESALELLSRSDVLEHFVSTKNIGLASPPVCFNG